MRSTAFLMLISLAFAGCNHTLSSKKTNQYVDTIPSTVVDKAVIYGDTAKFSFNNLSSTSRDNYLLHVAITGLQEDHCTIPSGTYYNTNTIFSNKSDDTLVYTDWTCSHSIWVTNNKFVFANDEENSFCGGCDNNMLSTFSILPHSNKKIDLIVRIIDVSEIQSKTFRIGMVLERVLKSSDFHVYAGQFETDQRNLQAQTQNLTWSNEIPIP